MSHTAQNSNISTIDHMTHINNLGNIYRYGLQNHFNSHKQVDISNIDVNNRRKRLNPITNRSIHEFVPFYFNPRNAMLYSAQCNFKKHIIILGFNDNIMTSDGALFTDGNAASNDTVFTDNLADISDYNWRNIQSDRWCENGINNNDVKRQMMAEVLINKSVDTRHLTHIYCETNEMKLHILQNYEMSGVKVIVKQNLFFRV